MQEDPVTVVDATVLADAATPPVPRPQAPPLPRAGIRVAPLWLRLLAGLLDLAPPAGLAALGTLVAWRQVPPDLPPRWWNAFDYAVDLFNGHPEVLAVPALAFVVAFVAWETLWTRLVGAAPVARLAGIRVVALDGHPAGLVRSFLRSVLALVLGLALGIGPAWALLSPRRRMLHDILCRCLAAVGR